MVNQETLKASDRVLLARHPKRPDAMAYIEALFEDFYPLAGDRYCGEDESIIGGPATFGKTPVMIIAHRKGNSLEDRVRFRFGMPNPEGYRKAQRLMSQAEKFQMPIITFVDTPGAYPGKEAEERGQGEAIAKCLALMSNVKVPIISVFIGEGGSGGALAIGICDYLIMLENSIFSILSPEGFASILWKDGTRWEEASEVMKLTAEELKKLGIADCVVSEYDAILGKNGAHENPKLIIERVGKVIEENLSQLITIKGETLAEKRYKKLRAVGAIARKVEE